MDIMKDIETAYRFVKYELDDELDQYLEESVDMEEIGNSLLNDDTIDKSILKEALEKYIFILNYIENETSIATQVSDDVYDQVVEKYKDLGGRHEIGVQQNQASSKKFGYHKYPELRGSLNKIHYLKNSDIPKKDSRKSLEYFISNIIREISSQNVSVEGPITITADFKWDGTSHVFEFKKGVELERVLTRYDVDNNLGMDITHIFKDYDLNKLLFTPLPKNIKDSSEFGLKVETFMPTKYFNNYISDMGDEKCNRRSAITSIVNRGEDEFDQSMLSYLAIKPLQISSVDYIDVSDDTGWIYIGKLFDRHQYIHVYSINLTFEVKSLRDLIDNMDSYPVTDCIHGIQSMAGEIVPIDGVVFTILNEKIIAALGRSGNKNKFQIAFKFPQGSKKTILKDVEFPVGPTAGSITPLAIVKPVVINGNTITNASLSNFDKMERLDLNIGDEVIIKYDIIPKLEKDDTCKKGTGKKIVRLTHCPICNSDLKGGARCLNPDCDAKLSGKIYNYVRKMKIKGVGKKVIEKFVDKGYLSCIGDLYRLPDHMKSITRMPGFGAVSFSNILAGIYGKVIVYPHEFLGAIGIPDVSTETMKKVCQNMENIMTMTDTQLIESVPQMTQIKGIGEITAWKIVDGIIEKLDEIEDIIPRLTFLDYPKEVIPPKEIVLFTECRDYEFVEYLESINIKVANSYVKDLTYLIVPDNFDILTSKNVKVNKAKSASLPIISLSDAKSKFGYV